MEATEARIRSAFPERPLPAAFFEAIERPWQDMQEELTSRIRGRAWGSVSLLDWRRVGSVAAFKGYLVPETFAYYTPSLLMGSISEPQFSDYGLEAVLPSNQRREPRGDWWARFAAAMNNSQRDAIRSFIAFQRRSHHAADVVTEELVGAAEMIWA